MLTKNVVVDLELTEAQNELLRIDSERYGLYRLSDEKRKIREEEIIETALEWAHQYSDEILFMLQVALGKVQQGIMPHSPNPLLLRTLGKLGDSSILPELENELNQCKKKHCLFSRDLLSTLMTIESAEAVKIVNDLFKKPKGNKLVFDFLFIMEEEPKIVHLPIYLHIIRKTGVIFKASIILAKLDDSCNIDFQSLLVDKSKSVREVAIQTLLIHKSENIPKEILDILSNIAFNKREDLMCRSYASDILSKYGLEIPLQFKRRAWKNVTTNVRRLLEGIINPRTRNRRNELQR
jgi:hypothetical protein